MSNILTLDPIMAEPERPIARRVRRVSRSMAFLFTSLVALYVLLIAVLLITGLFFGQHVHLGPKGTAITFAAGPALAGATLLSDLPAITRAAGLANILIATAPVLVLLWHLRALFALYATGIVFARKNARHLKYAGVALATFPAAKFAANLIFHMAGGTDQAAIFQPWLLLALVAGAVIYVIAQVMEFGHEIEAEKDSFI